MMPNYAEDITLSVVASASFTASATFGHTGRTVLIGENYARAKCFRQAEEAGQASRELRRTFADEIKMAPLMTGDPLLCFRGRKKNLPPTSREMGPPPVDRELKAGRYHMAGQCVLYLSDSEYGVRNELGEPHAGHSLYVQRYRLPLSRLRIADFSAMPQESFVAAVFSFAEECCVEGYGNSSYRFSQVIGNVVRHFFDGMRVPGARGTADRHYSNIIVFGPHPDWEQWLDSSADPYPLT